MTKANFLAICYADIFSYPLTKDELNYWQINDRRLKNIRSFTSALGTNGKFFFLKPRRKIIDLRLKRANYTSEKLLFSKKISYYLSFLPGVKMVALTGTLAMSNSDASDDIDLLIIASPNRIWTVRLLTTLFLDVLGVRRHPQDKRTNNKICLNMFLDEDHLAFPAAEQNLYTAHEILQTRPLTNKDQTYQKYLLKNKWVREYLPYAYDHQVEKLRNPKTKKNSTNLFFDFLEQLFYKLQFLYMKKKITKEKIEEGRIFFHPLPLNQIILDEYNKRARRYFS